MESACITRRCWENSDGYPMWPWFSDFRHGAGFSFKTYIAKRVSGTVVVRDAAHSVSTKRLPATFVIGEERMVSYSGQRPQ